MIIRGMKESDIMPLYALEEQCFCLSDRWSMADIRKAYELEHFFVLVAEVSRGDLRILHCLCGDG